MFFEDYFIKLKTQLDLIENSNLEALSASILSASSKNKKIIIAGNGGSSSIASHLSVDLTNAANIRAINFNDVGLITCFSNDYGYENWISRALDSYANPGDLIILISSSGQSKNMLVAAKKARDLGVSISTFTGFNSNNPLRELGDINFWVDSKEYNIVEMTHHVWLLAIVDYIISKNIKI
jgi:D-sedoheptulose 7-phosphate isomerase